jgi:predicted lipid-binding transport protein (Tim44 family)
MPQETDGANLLSLLWLAYIYWTLWSWLDRMSSSDQDAHTEKPEGPSISALKQMLLTPQATEASSHLPGPEAIISCNAEISDSLSQIEQRDRSFAVADFLVGAAKAYEAVTLAFATGDRMTLKDATSPEVCNAFVSAIIEREARGERTETTFVRVAAPEVIDARVQDDQAQIVVRFGGDLFSVTRSVTGAVISGDPNRSIKTVDVWTFAKSPALQDPNWTLIATNVAQP